MAAKGSVLLVVLELAELKDIEVTDCVPYGGPLFEDLLDDELLEVLRRAFDDEELRSPESHVRAPPYPETSPIPGFLLTAHTLLKAGTVTSKSKVAVVLPIMANEPSDEHGL